MKSAPLRFLLLVLGLWIGVRAAILLPKWPDGTGTLPATVAPAPVAIPEQAPQVAAAGPVQPARPVASQKYRPTSSSLMPPAPALKSAQNGATSASPAVLPPAGPPALPGIAPPSTPMLAGSTSVQGDPLSLPVRSAAFAKRWSLSGWLLVRREEGGTALAPGGTLGGSQAGARLTYALGSGLSLSARAYLPLRRIAGAEAAAGLDWRPLPAIPISLLAERRQRIGREGRAAFALTLYGGGARALAPRLSIHAYGQAGVVGLRSRDLFVDGSLRLARRVGPIDVGAGAWGAAQPGAARLDAGPSLSWRLPVPHANLRLQADWRFRLAGEAAPRSGPALTLATDF